jgi:hypothetical protein
VILHEQKEPELYILPMTAGLTPNALVVSHDYDGKKSKAEWLASGYTLRH